MGLAAFVVVSPQLLMWRYATGHFIASPYHNVPGVGFESPRLFELLLGVNRGFFIWFPITFMAVGGFFFMQGAATPFRAPVIVLFVSYALFLSSFRLWQAAGGFGGRYAVDMVILTAFPLAALFNATKPRWAQCVLGVIAAGCILWSLFLMTLLYRREISFYGVDRAAIFDVFWWRKEALLHWLQCR